MSEGLDVFSKKLKPCPFCGGEAELLTMRYKDVEVYGVFCRADLDQECQHGHFIDNYGTKAEAIAAWNRRSGHEEGCRERS